MYTKIMPGVYQIPPQLISEEEQKAKWEVFVKRVEEADAKHHRGNGKGQD